MARRSASHMSAAYTVILATISLAAIIDLDTAGEAMDSLFGTVGNAMS